MIHIPSAGCGWAISGGTYTCGGLPKLDEVFQTTDVTGQTIEGTTITYDEFDRVPRHIEGFRMTLSPIIDMSGGTPSQLEVPELACRVDFDPFNELVAGTVPSYVYNIDNAALTGNTNTQYTGFLDLYNQVKTYKDNFYTVNGDTISGSTEYIGGNFPTYKDQEEMGPGILEPMINTDFGEINVDMPPTPDLTVDAIIYSLVGLQGWRHAIDMRVNNLMVNAADTGMENLEAAKNTVGPCTNFQIQAISGYPFAPISEYTHTPGMVPQYTITGGTVKINNYTVVIPAGSTVSAPFTGYVEYWPTNTGFTGSVVYAPTGVSGHHIEYIGQVRPIENASGTTISGVTVRTPFPDGSSYRLYKIEQGDCIASLTYMDADDSGYVYANVSNGGIQYSTDPLLNSVEFGHITTPGTPNGSRGVQADAIIDYVATHGGTTGTGGRMYPNYAELATGEPTPPSGSGIAVTYVLPVSSGQTLHYLTDAPSACCFVRFAPAEGEIGTAFTLSEGSTAPGQVADADGFVRFTVLDDGSHPGTCVRLSIDDSDWSASLPVYRFGNFQTGYNGPFRVDGNGGISCPVCDQPTLSTDPRIIGHCVFNGIDRSDVHSNDIAGVTHGVQAEVVELTGSITDVYLHVLGVDQYVIDTESTIQPATGGAPAYTVWLARISGATETVDEVTGTTTYHNGHATQIHHGDIYVDGRWQ